MSDLGSVAKVVDRRGILPLIGSKGRKKYVRDLADEIANKLF